MKRLFYLFALLLCVSCSQPQKAELQRSVSGVTLGDNTDKVKVALDARGIKYKEGSVTLGESTKGRGITADDVYFAGNRFSASYIFLDDKLSVIMLINHGKGAKELFHQFKKEYKEKYPNNIGKDAPDDFELNDENTMIGLTTIDYPEFGLTVVGVIYAEQSMKSLAKGFFKDI